MPHCKLSSSDACSASVAPTIWSKLVHRTIPARTNETAVPRASRTRVTRVSKIIRHRERRPDEWVGGEHAAQQPAHAQAIIAQLAKNSSCEKTDGDSSPRRASEEAIKMLRQRGRRARRKMRLASSATTRRADERRTTLVGREHTQ